MVYMHIKTNGRRGVKWKRLVGQLARVNMMGTVPQIQRVTNSFIYSMVVLKTITREMAGEVGSGDGGGSHKVWHVGTIPEVKQAMALMKLFHGKFILLYTSISTPLPPSAMRSISFILTTDCLSI